MVTRKTARPAARKQAPRTPAKKANPKTRAKPVARKSSAGNPGPLPRLCIRMYRHGLGDCLLLRFRREDGVSTFNLLIDCGLIMVAENAGAKMTEVAKDLDQVCGGHLDVVVMTHEHWDHASGFSNAQARAVFDGIDVGEVWYGWTEDPQNELGKRLRKERAKKVQALASAASALAKVGNSPMAIERAAGISALLGFFGLNAATAKGGTIGRTREAFDYLSNRAGVKTRYCTPDKPPTLLRGVPDVRVYVLGPPLDEGLIKRSSPTKKGREVYELASEAKLADNLESAFVRLAADNPAASDSPTDDCPFDPTLRRRDGSSAQRASPSLDALIHESWDKPGEEWRKVEDDWTQAAEALALNLDSHTNNTCLVLAFEFEDTGDVFLFPADAQIGNWLSWQDLKWRVRTANGLTEVTGPDLLARTVFYKVGHHGSHNATLRSLGLEQMTHENLVAFIPVFRKQAEKNRWMGMPFGPLVKRLKEKTAGRLLQSDSEMPSAASLSTLPVAARMAFLSSVESEKQGLWFEYRVG